MIYRIRSYLASAAVALALAGAGAANATTLPPGFQQSTAISGLHNPIAVEFAPNGRVFVAEKTGIIKTFTNITDTSATQLADLRTEVHNYTDRGLMNIAVDPNFPAEPYVYVYYVHDAEIGGTAPLWGQPGQSSDTCPTPPGGSADGCVVSGRLSRLEVSGQTQTGPEQVLIEDWCQQYPSHAGGGLEFGADGYLYLTGGEGASYTFSDYGQDGDPINPCGDPPGGVGAELSPPTAEGGKLRSQDIRTTSDPLGLSGSLIRIDPDTGAGVPGNPLFSSTDTNERRYLAYGMRNPFRLAIRPGFGDVWVGDVGQGRWDEIDRVISPFGGPVNLGWPCYEGGLDSSGTATSLRQNSFDTLDLDLCEGLYAEGTATPPYWAYHHEDEIVPDENCHEEQGSALSGLAFAPIVGNFPDTYDGALFFADYARQCIWAMRPDANGLPDPATVEAFAQEADFPVDLEFGPNGELYYPDIVGDRVRRISHTDNPGNTPPMAVAAAMPQSGGVPLDVSFDASESSDPDPGEVLSYAWDLDEDGELDDSTSESPSFTYASPGSYTVTLRVTDTSGAFDEDTVTIGADSGPPVPTIDTPAAGTSWGVDESIEFTGSALDPEDGPLPGSALDWQLIVHHCTSPGNCHQHTIEDFENTAEGTFVAPDHEYPSHLELKLTATDSSDDTATVSRELYPRTVNITAESDPPGMTVSLGPVSGAAPVSATVIEGSTNTLSAPSVQIADNTTHDFSSWTDGQPQTHNVAPTSSTTYTARFAPRTPGTSTLTFNPGADAYVEEARPDNNFGTATTLRTNGGGEPGVESYVRFLVDGLVGRVQSAKLRLFSASSTGDGPAAYATSSSWSESTINWDNKPPPAGDALSDSEAISTGVWTEWDVTPAVTGEGSVSFRLASLVNDSISFDSRESATAVRRPELVLTVLHDAFPRPKGASPVRVSLVPAFDACASPNSTHGPPLEQEACDPPAQSSSELTVGAPEVNGEMANASGSVRLKVNAGIPSTPEDEADVTVAFSLVDVRHTTTLTDYLGELQMRAALRITDRGNGPTVNPPATLQDLELPVTVTCALTLDLTVGSTCDLITTFDAVLPGVIDEGSRTVWEIGQIEVLDGGPDGLASTPGNGVFAKQGVFVP